MDTGDTPGGGGGDGQGDAEAEVWTDAAASPGLSAATRSWDRPGRALPGACRRSGPADALTLDLWPPEA